MVPWIWIPACLYIGALMSALAVAIYISND